MASSSKDPSNIEEGLRFYVGRFPWKVAPLLAEAKRVFCKTPGGTQSGEHSETATKKAKKKEKRKDKKDRKQKKHKAKKHKKTEQEGQEDPEGRRCGPVVRTETEHSEASTCKKF